MSLNTPFVVIKTHRLDESILTVSVRLPILLQEEVCNVCLLHERYKKTMRNECFP
jgi:hypothetical protein